MQSYLLKDWTQLKYASFPKSTLYQCLQFSFLKIIKNRILMLALLLEEKLTE